MKSFIKYICVYIYIKEKLKNISYFFSKASSAL